MVGKFNISMKTFVLVTKVTPMLLAFCHLINILLNYFYIELVFMNYLAGISIISTLYMYITSYALKLCEYYRMFLHYCVAVNIINIIDCYIGIPVNDIGMFMILAIITIIFMFLIIYFKFFKS